MFRVKNLYSDVGESNVVCKSTDIRELATVSPLLSLRNSTFEDLGVDSLVNGFTIVSTTFADV
tara:strand:- start:32 stop:220 length:189 start_codon:yes stop_codon:yes gene_type:complete